MKSLSIILQLCTSLSSLYIYSFLEIADIDLYICAKYSNQQLDEFNILQLKSMLKTYFQNHVHVSSMRIQSRNTIELQDRDHERDYARAQARACGRVKEKMILV
jgi:hypothetical protein